jgi:cellobiose phosphorylase
MPAKKTRRHRKPARGAAAVRPAAPSTFGRYGRFSADGREFIVTDPLLPRPWMNVLSNGKWCYVCSHLGGGYSFYEDPLLRRITRWQVDGVPRETVGKFIYIRDDDSGKWWCANGYPPTRRLKQWQCTHGLGYTTIESEHDGVGAQITYFVPVDEDPCELWLVSVENRSPRTRHLSVFEYAEFALGNYKEEATWREFYILFNRTRHARGRIYAASTQWIKYAAAWQSVGAEGNNIALDVQAVLASSRRPDGCETERYKFVGLYRDLKDPAAVADGGDLAGEPYVEGRDACGAMQHKLTLKPGEKAEFVMLLGAVPADARDASALTKKYLTVAKAKRELARRKAWWAGVLESPRIETPDGDLNRWANIWLRYQAGNLAWWSRNVGYCYMGIYGYGTRDECQDLIAHLPSDPAHVRRTILERLACWMYEDGRVVHSSSQTTRRGDFTNHSDDPTNLQFIVSKYVRETGDFHILREDVPYYESQDHGDLFEHCMRGWQRFFNQFSERGLPLILSADWNDAFDQAGHRGRGESVMLAGWASYVLNLFLPVCDWHGFGEISRWLRQRQEAMIEAVNRCAWDGEWYVRAFHDDGTPLGTRAAGEGRLWANAQTWCILGGIADAERTAKCLASMDKYLNVSKGSLAFWPAFTKPDPRYGVISRFAPGVKENGAVFTHNLMWRLVAETHCGRGNVAWKLLKSNLPTTLAAQDPDLYQVEPYVQRQFTYAPMSQRYGEGSHSWATGGAMWNWHVVLEGFLGIQPELEGLRLDPCFPSEWREARVLRRWRGGEYEIRIHNPDGVEKGVRAVLLDGQPLRGNLLPVPQEKGERHRVEVVMGA